MSAPPPPLALDFTGERFAPEVKGAIWHEHWHRYGLVAPLAKGRRVLDAACGEGYGSFLLAQDAAEVVGVDLSADTIAHAQRRYQSPRLRFVAGSCAALPLPDRSVDLVVSFETIEHLAEQEQTIAEFRRVLVADGVLVISSPNKEIYGPAFAATNHWHVKELTRDELEALLAPAFPAQRWYAQRVLAHSVVWQEGAARRPASVLALDAQMALRERDEPAPPMYFLVVAGARVRDLPALPALSLFDDGEGSLYADYMRSLLREKRLYWDEFEARKIAEDRLAELVTAVNALSSERKKCAALEARIAGFDAQLDAEREVQQRGHAELARTHAELVRTQGDFAHVRRQLDAAERALASGEAALERESAALHEQQAALARMQGLLAEAQVALERAQRAAEAQVARLEEEQRAHAETLAAGARLAEVLAAEQAQVRAAGEARQRDAALLAHEQDAHRQTMAALAREQAAYADERDRHAITQDTLAAERDALARERALHEAERARRNEVAARLAFRESFIGWARLPFARLRALWYRVR